MSFFELDLDVHGRWVWRLMADGEVVATSAAAHEHTTTTYAHVRILRRGQAQVRPVRSGDAWTWEAIGVGGDCIATGQVVPTATAAIEAATHVLHEAANATIERHGPFVHTTPFWSALPA